MNTEAVDTFSDQSARGKESCNSFELGSGTQTYNAPPASWFFTRGSNPSIKNVSDSPRKDSVQEDSRKLPFTEAGMVSDNEQVQTKDVNAESMDDEDDHEGFNFIAVSNSLLMAGRSFEQVSKREEPFEQDALNEDDKSESNNRGVLIVEGVSVGDDEGTTIAGNGINPSHVAHNNDASVLTIPGSDSLPSDIGTISNHDDDDDDPLLEDNDHPGVLGDHAAFPYLLNYPPLVHRFLRNLHKSSGRLRLVSDATDYSEVVTNSMIGNESEVQDRIAFIEIRLSRQRRISALLTSLLMCTLLIGAAFWTSQKRVWEKRLIFEEEERGRLMRQNEALTTELHTIVEEVAVATVRAESLVKEQERLLLERDFATGEYRRLFEAFENIKHGSRNQRASGDDLSWFFGDPDGEHSKGHESNSYTFADNCWIKIKANIESGICGDNAWENLKMLWKGKWEEYYNRDYVPTEEVNGFAPDLYTTMEGDTYYPPQDPLRDLYSVLQYAGQTLVTTVSRMVESDPFTSD